MRWRGPARAVALDALRVDDREQAYLPHPRRAVGQNFVQSLRRDLPAVVLIPSAPYRAAVDRSPAQVTRFARRGLGDVASSRSVATSAFTIRPPGVVRRGTRKPPESRERRARSPEPRRLKRIERLWGEVIRLIRASGAFACSTRCANDSAHRLHQIAAAQWLCQHPLDTEHLRRSCPRRETGNKTAPRSRSAACPGWRSCTSRTELRARCWQ